MVIDTNVLYKVLYAFEYQTCNVIIKYLQLTLFNYNIFNILVVRGIKKAQKLFFAP